MVIKSYLAWSRWELRVHEAGVGPRRVDGELRWANFDVTTLVAGGAAERLVPVLSQNNLRILVLRSHFMQ